MKTERLWPPGVLRLTWQGLRRAWLALLAGWALLTAINVAAYYLRQPVEPSLSFYGPYLARTIGQIAITAIVTAWLVASVIEKAQPAALSGSPTWRLVARGWAASFLSNLLIQAPAILGMGAITLMAATRNPGSLSYIYAVQGVVALAASVMLGFALGESLTRRLGPVQALGASVRLTRGNRFALLGLMILLSILAAALTSGLYSLMTNAGMTNGQVIGISAAQCLFGVLSAVLLTGVYLELRRIQRAGQPEGISETFD